MSLRRNTGISAQIAELISEWRTSIDLDGPEGPAILSRTRSITDAARMVGLGSAEVAEYRRQRAIPTVFVLDGGRPEPRFPIDQFDVILELVQVRMPIERARLSVGVPCYGVEQLVAMRLLDQEEHPFVTARYQTMQIVAASVDVLKERLSGEARGDGRVCTLPLHSAMKAVGGRLKPWGPAFRALVDATLTSSQRLDFVLAPGNAPLSRRILIAKTDVERIRGFDHNARDPAYRQITYSETMSKIDAGEVLNLGFSQSIPLLAAIRTKAGTHERLVPVAYVLDLARTHISASEIAARCGVSPQAGWRYAEAKQVPKLGPGGFCRSEANKRIFAAHLADRDAA